MKYESSIDPTYGFEVIKMVPETKEEIQEFEDARKERELYWCKCTEETNSYRIPDNKHPDVSKHHYRCEKCDKITQIG